MEKYFIEASIEVSLSETNVGGEQQGGQGDSHHQGAGGDNHRERPGDINRR